MPQAQPLTSLQFFNSHTLRNDSMGAGHYGAPRVGSNGVNYPHKGVDILAPSGLFVKINVPGTITEIGYAYANDNRYNSLHIDLGNGYRLKLLYCRPLFAVGKKLNPGNTIAVMQNLNLKHGNSMKNHLHVELYLNDELIDPTNFLF